MTFEAVKRAVFVVCHFCDEKKCVGIHNCKQIIDYVKRKEQEDGNEHFVLGIESVLEYAEQLPTIEARPVVHGRWENNEYGLQCSKCRCDSLYNGFNHPAKSTFCPNCGADMRGDDNG